MITLRTVIGAAVTFAALSMSANAGEPGPNLQPYTPAPTPHVQTQTYHQSQITTRDLNMQEYHVGPRYTYTRPQTVGCYTPNPCAPPAPVVNPCANPCAPTVTRRVIHTAPAPVVTRSVVQAPVVNPCASPCGTTVTRRVVTPTPVVNPCATPCGTTTTYRVVRSVPAPVVDPCANPCGAPVVHYAPPPPPPAPAPQPWVNFVDCGDSVIRRLPNTRDGERSYEVCYSDLMHYSAYERNSELIERIETAAQRACRDSSSALYSLRASRNCRSEATEVAVYSADVPGLVEFYLAREGRPIPNVHVGDPIYR